jgi:hypothetical protein
MLPSYLCFCYLCKIIADFRQYVLFVAMQLSKNGLNLKTIRHFIIDECDKVLENVGELLAATRFSCDLSRRIDWLLNSTEQYVAQQVSVG